RDPGSDRAPNQAHNRSKALRSLQTRILKYCGYPALADFRRSTCLKNRKHSLNKKPKLPELALWIPVDLFLANQEKFKVLGKKRYRTLDTLPVRPVVAGGMPATPSSSQNEVDPRQLTFLSLPGFLGSSQKTDADSSS